MAILAENLLGGDSSAIIVADGQEMLISQGLNLCAARMQHSWHVWKAKRCFRGEL